MQRDVAGGIVLIAGALAGVFALALHPTGHDMLAGADAPGQARLSVPVHLVALAGDPAMDVHGSGMITFAHASWLIWIGILLVRGARTGGPPG